MTTKTQEANPVPDVKPEKKLKADPKGVKLDADLQKDVDRICAAEGIPFGHLVNDAVRAHVTNPVRQRNLVLRSMAITRQEIEKAKAAGIVPVEDVQEFLEQLQETVAGVKSPPGKKRKSFRLPPPLPTLVKRALFGEDDKE